jgi:hypothetical protein
MGYVGDGTVSEDIARRLQMTDDPVYLPDCAEKIPLGGET